MRKIKILMAFILIFVMMLTIIGCNRVDPKTEKKNKTQTSKISDEEDEDKKEVKEVEEEETKPTVSKPKNIEDYLPYSYASDTTYNIKPSSVILKEVEGNNQYSGFTTQGRKEDIFAFSVLTRISCDVNTYDTAWVLFNESNEVIDESTSTVNAEGGGIYSYRNYETILPIGQYTVAYFVKKSNTEDAFVPAAILDFDVHE